MSAPRGAQSKEDRMPAVVWVVGAIVVLVGALLAVDWLAAGRSGRRRFLSAKTQNSDNAGVGYADIQNQFHGRDMQGHDGNI
jgi:hypothetical protein